MVHYTGFITIPENTSVRFMVAADDGGTVNIDGYEFGTWNLKGCRWSQQVTLPLSGGTYPLDGWFYEWTGGTCYMLAWQLDGGDWEIVPEWAFTTTSTPATTTTTSTAPTTTAPATTTTSTTVQETTTTVEETTTTSSTTTTTTEPETTTTSSTVDTSPPATSPTPEAVAPPPATTIESATTVPEESTPEAQQPPVTDPPVPDTSLVEPPAPEPTVQDPREPAAEDAPILPPDASESSESDAIPETVVDTPETLSEALNASPEELTAYIKDLPAEQVVALVDALLADNPTPEQVTALATNPEVLAVVSTEQAAEIFEALDVGDLTDTEVEALIAAVQDAPTEIRETFEDTINIFGEGLDNYVPLGSTIPVGTRRTLIAVTAGITLAAAGSRIRR